ncbi:MAG: ATP-dependent acyl-CoA ligase, partial [Rhizobacter sp.]|nr:ATP-dependent acyl-CoA ligase [Rhizobacter sp.]
MTDAWTLPDVLNERMRSAPDRAFISMMGEPALSVGEIEWRSRRVANGLRELGVGFGDRVLVMLPNSLEFIETWFAVNRLGAVLVTVNTAYRGSFLEHLANNSQARVMVVAASFLPVVTASEAAMPGLQTLVVVQAAASEHPTPQRLHCIDFESLRSAAETGIDVHVKPSDLCAIVYTSGTTGPSKGVMIPHAQMFLNPYVYLEQMGVGRDDVFYSALPLFHTNALALQVYGALIAGCRVHLAPQFSASRWLPDIRASGATVTNLLGVMTEFVFRQPETRDDADNALRIINAVPTPPPIAAAFEARFGVQLIELYGSTEVNCPLYMPRHEPRRDGSCGKVVDAWFECRIADAETGHAVPDGEVGELLVRPRAPGALMAGYNAMPEETVKAWRDLWFHTGDAMRRDADGH